MVEETQIENKKDENPKKSGRISQSDFYKNFNGKFQKVGELSPLISRFKDYYIERKMANPKLLVMGIINDFNEEIKPFTFFPYPRQYRNWRVKWDAYILSKMGMVEETKPLVQAIKTRGENNSLLAPDESELDMGARHLGGELVNDALNMLHEDKQFEETFESDELIKRRTYILNVFNYVMKAVHTKEGLLIKKSAETRETAGFLMDIMRQATAGKISPETIGLLKNSFVKNNEPAQL